MKSIKTRNSFLRIFFVLLFFARPSYSQIVYTNSSENLAVEDQIYYVEDKDNSYPVEQVSQRTDFKLISKKVHNFGITSSSIWLRLTISNKSDVGNLILQVNQPIIDEVEFFSFNAALKRFTSIKMGEFQVFQARNYLTPQYLFDLKLPRDSTRTYYLKVRCKENMQIPISIGTRISVLNYTVVSNLASGIYIGIMLVMVLYNLFIFGTVRDKSYLLYSLYIVIVLLTQTSLQGLPFQFLWPNHPAIAMYSQFFFPSLVGISALEFFKKFLFLKERMPGAYKLSFILLIPYVFSPFLSVFGLYHLSFTLIDASALIVSVFMMTTAVMIYRRGYSEARFFLIGWSIFLLGVCIYVLKDFEILPYNNFTRYTMHFGSAIEVILLSFALADRINILKKEKEDSQAQALVALEENQKLISGQNVILEQKVHERTLELEETNEELNVTLTYLKDTQSQLVDAEKMASLGQLTAGIAHEINNPINFVSANLRPLKMDISDILELIQKYEEITPNESPEPKLREIESFRKKIDLDYLKKEIETLLSGIEDGARRTTEIVSGLKNFSRLDESDMKLANINEGIESTLILLKSAIPENVKVITRLGNIPPIECLPGKLNQVFMNLLSNALYAIKQNKTVPEHQLIITSEMAGEKVAVSVEDTGIGMTPEVKAKIFEPFFTTKDVGEGTGLGMSIVFKIVETHQAKMEVESEYGKGTKITLILNKKIS
ncbi:MAG: 7TM diverse intracellular signaling domain-containing protein [Bacteroidota bacterium]